MYTPHRARSAIVITTTGIEEHSLLVSSGATLAISSASFTRVQTSCVGCWSLELKK